MSVKIDTKTFLERLQRLHKQIVRSNETYNGAHSVAIMHGKRSDDVQDGERATVAIQIHLLGYEFPDTLMVITPKTFYILANRKKVQYLEDASTEAKKANLPIQIKLLSRNKADNDQQNLESILHGVMNDSGSDSVVLGEVDPGTAQGGFAEGWKSAVQTAKEASKLSVVDATKGIDAAMSVKDATAMENIKKASSMTCRLFRKVFREEMERVIDENDSKSHFDIARNVEEAMENLSKIGVKLEPEHTDLAYLPVIQSGGDYSLHIDTIEPTKKTLSPDIVVVSLAGRYRAHCAGLARTYLVNPTDSVSKAYATVLEAHQILVDELKPGKVIGEIVKQAEQHLRKHLPQGSRLPTDFGYGIGLRARESYLTLNTANKATVQVGSVFFIRTGALEIPLSDASKANSTSAISKLSTYGLCLADTILAAGDRGTVVLTEKVTKEPSEIAYDLADEEEESEEDDSDAEIAKKGAQWLEPSADEMGRAVGGRSARLAAKAAESEGDMEDRYRRAREQAVLFQKQVDEARKKLVQGDHGTKNEKEEAPVKPLVSYDNALEMPREDLVRHQNQIIIDKPRDTVIVPIFGMRVPYHINTIKSVYKEEHEGKTMLRINFYAPGQSLGNQCPPNMVQAVEQHPALMYIRTLSFASRDPRNLSHVERMIKDMQRRSRQEAQQQKEEAEIVKQPALRIDRTQKIPRLQDLNIWPVLTGRKTIGSLEAHANGLRFVSSKLGSVDIIYSNIKHAIFQPCQKEHTVLIHFHLKHPILINRKKRYDVQFYTEVIEASQALDGRRRSMYDPDELAEEQRERKLRASLNEAFRRFVDKVQERAGNIEFDMPSRDLGFPGVVHKEMTFVMPCTNCIAALTDKPPFVLSLDEIQHVHFERVIFGAKNFDMVIVLKEGRAKKGDEEFVRISAIPMEELESIQQWLNDVVEVTFTWGAATLNWKNIIQEFVRSPDFYLSQDEEGEKKPVGWEFLTAESDDEKENDDEKSEDSDFGDEIEDDVEEEEEEDDDEFDDAVASDDDDEEDEFDEDDDDEDGEGDDWDELERKAARADKEWAQRERGRDGAIVEEEIERRGHKRSRDVHKSSHGGGDRKKKRHA